VIPPASEVELAKEQWQVDFLQSHYLTYSWSISSHNMTQVGIKAVMSWSNTSDITTYKSWHRSSHELTKWIHPKWKPHHWNPHEPRTECKCLPINVVYQNVICNLFFVSFWDYYYQTEIKYFMLSLHQHDVFSVCMYKFFTLILKFKPARVGC
jgi:hypothetical protein